MFPVILWAQDGFSDSSLSHAVFATQNYSLTEPESILWGERGREGKENVHGM